MLLNSGESTGSSFEILALVSFQSAAQFGVLSTPVSLFVADFNGDGLPDIVTATRTPFDAFGNIAVLMNNTQLGP